MSMDPSGSYDEEAFIAEAGVGDGADAMPEGARLNSSSFTPRGPNAIENALTAFYRTTRLGWIADRLKGNVAVCAIAWVCLIVGGIAHLCRHMGMESPTSISIETAATAAVYALAGTSEFVDVSYELAVGNVNIHVLTTLAVAGTVLLGCAIEGRDVTGALRVGALRRGSTDGSRARRPSVAVGDGAGRGDDRGVERGWVAGRWERAAGAGEGCRGGHERIREGGAAGED